MENDGTKKKNLDLKKRETFSTGFAVFFATLGSAVGLGNIWKFPYLIGTNGGGAFLLVYILCVIFVGLPVMISEFYIGRKTRSNAIGAFEKLKVNHFWKIIGFMGVLSAFLIMFFYSCVGGWVYSYVFKALSGGFKNITPDGVNQKFLTTVVGPIPPIIWQAIVIIVVSIIIILGVQKGIEKVTKTLMPLLFVLIIICDIRALTLPGASQGLRFLFNIDFSKLKDSKVILSALGLAFFKLSLGMGTMITYGSYFTKDNNMMYTSAKVALSDTIVSILAGIAIFPVVFSFGMEPEMGPSLLFVTIPLVFSKIPFGSVLLVAFFVLASIAATTAMISMMEVPVAYFTEGLKLSRKKAVIITSSIVLFIGIFATLSADKSSVLGGVAIFGKSIFDIFDYISSNILMPIGGLLLVLLIGWFLKKDDIQYELSNNQTLNNSKVISVYYTITKYITPILLSIVFLNSLGLLKPIVGAIAKLF